MTDRWLVINVRLLHGSFHGRGDGGQPEWPPSPARLFQALVASAGRRRTDAESAALGWLEAQSAPVIDAPPRCAGTRRRTYVPNNDADQHPDGASRMLKVVQATHLDDGATLRYSWKVSAADDAKAGALTSLARRVRALGWGIDMAIGHGEVVETLPPLGEGAVRWLPQPSGVPGQALRAPRAGTLAGLDTDHRAAQQRIEGATQTLTGRSAPFDRVAYRGEHDLPPRPIRVFKLLNDEGGTCSFWPTRVRDLAAMLRHQAHHAAKRADWDPRTIGGYVCGHGDNGGPPPANRLSYLPIPSIGYQYTDGLIRRVAIAEAPGGDGRRLEEMADRLVGQWLTCEGRGDSIAMLAQAEPDDRVLRYYLGSHADRGATVWASVTPVVLPGFNARGRRNQHQHRIIPDLVDGDCSGHARKTRKLVLKTLAEAGISADLVAEVWLQKVPLWPNLPRAEKTDRPAYLQDRPPFHVRLRFKQPVHGPITLGAGRFVGLGTFAAPSRGDP
ncbi:MAG: type I-U CRISPR-associated protein Csb2 [Phycisphaeraceae bacterium]